MLQKNRRVQKKLKWADKVEKVQENVGKIQGKMSISEEALVFVLALE